MNSSILYPNNEELKDQSDKQVLAINEYPLNIAEGGEFLDDAIRMKDLPLMFSEEKIDSGRSLYLF